MKLDPRTAFLVHEPTMFAHYASVWECLDPDEFIVVTLGITKRSEPSHGVPEFFEKIDRLGYQSVALEDVVRSRKRFIAAVSNHPLGGNSALPDSWYRYLYELASAGYRKMMNFSRKISGRSAKYQKVRVALHQFPPLRVAKNQIRFMYGADISDAWSLNGWNRIYDLFLCHGPNDQEAITSRFSGRAVQMGYPRYDRYFTNQMNLSPEIAEFKIDRERPTLLWMPTWDVLGDEICSIRQFAVGLSEFLEDTNLIVRPHPVSLREDKEAVALLESLGFMIDRDPSRDMSRMFKLADMLLCDHGGSAFGALYLRKRLVLLRTDGSEKSKMAKGSSNSELARYYPVLSPKNIDELRSLLDDDDRWSTVLSETDSLTARYFANLRGNSAQTAANAIRQYVSELTNRGL